jgi:hypothetical protein
MSQHDTTGQKQLRQQYNPCLNCWAYPERKASSSTPQQYIKWLNCLECRELLFGCTWLTHALNAAAVSVNSTSALIRATLVPTFNFLMLYFVAEKTVVWGQASGVERMLIYTGVDLEYVSNNGCILRLIFWFTMSQIFFFSFFRNQQSEYWILYELMCWLVNCRGEVPSSEISLVDSITVDWFMASRK